jgi:hypothetical protein
LFFTDELWRPTVTTDHSVITYIRVSTSQQGRSGLGIEAQRQALAQFAQAEGFTVAREFVEVETGKGSDALDRRPQLKAALTAAKKLRCHVAVTYASNSSQQLRPEAPHGPLSELREAVRGIIAGVVAIGVSPAPKWRVEGCPEQHP